MKRFKGTPSSTVYCDALATAIRPRIRRLRTVLPMHAIMLQLKQLKLNLPL